MPKPANLIFFISDNHNRDFLGAAGHPAMKTPALDSIASRGVRFSNAYCTSPLCCPSRASIATGRYPHQTGYWDNALAYDGKTPTWHHRVRESGADMAAIGKLHYQSAENDNGFSEEIATLHIVDGEGALISLLRSTPDGVPRRKSHKAIYAKSGVGEADYQIYDREVTGHAVRWLRTHARQDKPWVIFVSYASPHPPFQIPQRLWDMYPLDQVSMPVKWRPDERPKHPATEYLAWMNHLQEGMTEDFIRRSIAGYCGLISHVDEQIGQVLDEADSLGILEDTRVIYTSDHGEAVGNHGILGKGNQYEHAIGVPLLMAGPEIPRGRVVDQCVSHVDLFPTVLEAAGAGLEPEDSDLPGRSLWPALTEKLESKPVFAEFHAMGSRNSSFMLRKDNFKFIYHVDMPKQLFDLAADPREENDLLENGASHPAADDLERTMRQYIDPEQINARSKADQKVHMERFGGAEEVRKAGVFSVSPIPGKEPQIERV